MLQAHGTFSAYREGQGEGNWTYSSLASLADLGFEFFMQPSDKAEAQRACWQHGVYMNACSNVYLLRCDCLATEQQQKLCHCRLFAAALRFS